MRSGLLLIDKPVGPTSHDLVAIVRRGTGIRRVGHAGTLDPLASGVMVLALGNATRLLEYFMAHDKRYLADIILGIETDTCDSAGQVIATLPVSVTLSSGAIDEALNAFRGPIEQVPPGFSAIKIDGKKAYELARRGQQVDLPARRVVIHDLAIVSYEQPHLALSVHCSAGTYIRSLARDIGHSLQTGASLSGLVREASGSFTRADCVSLADLGVAFRDGTWHRYLLNPVDHLPEWQKILLTGDEISAVRSGRAISRPCSQGRARAIDSDGVIIAVLAGDEAEDLWYPRKVFPGSS